MANTIVEVIFEKLFFKFNNINKLFGKKRFIQRFYITNKVLLIIKHVQIINIKDFVIAALDANNKTFIIYVAI